MWALQWGLASWHWWGEKWKKKDKWLSEWLLRSETAGECEGWVSQCLCGCVPYSSSVNNECLRNTESECLSKIPGVNVTVCRWTWQGATKQSTAAKTHQRSKKESTCPSTESLSPSYPALLICPLRPNESLTSASQTPWPRRRWSAGRGFAWRWGLCRPFGCVGQAGTSRRSCPLPWCLLIVSRPSRPLCRRGRNSSLWRRPAARSTRSPPGYQEHCEERTQRFERLVVQQQNSSSVT